MIWRGCGVSRLNPPNLDIKSAIITALGVERKLPLIEAQLRQAGGLDVDKLLNLGDYTRALAHADAAYITAILPACDAQKLLEDATKQRAVLISCAKLLVLRGLLEPEEIESLSGSVGYRNVVFDLVSLTELFAAKWSDIETKAGITSEELLEISAGALSLAEQLDERERASAAEKETTELRQRTFTLFYRVYDQLRRGARFIRWDEGDTDDFVPSLYAHRRRRQEESPNADEGGGSNSSTSEYAEGEVMIDADAIPGGTDVSGASFRDAGADSAESS